MTTNESTEPSVRDALIDLIRDEMMSTDHPVSQWEQDFADKILAALSPQPATSREAVDALKLADEYAAERDWNGAYHAMRIAYFHAAALAPAPADVRPVITAQPVEGERKFQIGDRVTKMKGSWWTGLVVGTYRTALTPEGYAVESENEPGSVQIYPAAALASKGGVW